MAVRFGILGCARIAEAALLEPARQIENVEVAAIGSRSSSKAHALAGKHAIPRAYDGYEAVLADKAIDAIYIPLPNSLHAEWTLRALEAGKAVLCEKPLTSNAREAAAVANAASRSGCVLMEAFHYRYHPMALFISEVLSEGRLGAVTSVRARLNIPGKLVPADDIRFQSALSGGALMDVGAYCVNAVRLAAGEPLRVETAIAQLVGPGVDGAMGATFSYASGVRGEIECSLIAQRMAAELEIVAERGKLRAVNPFLPHMGHRLELEIDGVRSEHHFGPQSSYYFQACAFVAGMRGEPGVLLTGAEDAVLNMGLIDAIYHKAGLEPRAAA